MKILNKLLHNTDKYRDKYLSFFVKNDGLTVKYSKGKAGDIYGAGVKIPKVPLMCGGAPLTIEDHVEYLTKSLLKTLLVTGHEKEEYNYGYLKDYTLFIEDGPIVWSENNSVPGPVIKGTVRGYLEHN